MKRSVWALLFIGTFAFIALTLLNAISCRTAATSAHADGRPVHFAEAAPAPGLVERQRMFVHALTATPVNTEELRRTLRDIGHVRASYYRWVESAGAKAGWKEDGVPRRKLTEVALNRDAQGFPPEDWISQITAPLANGFTPLGGQLAFVPPPDVVPERDRLLAEADEKLRAGLLELSRRFPQMRRSTHGTIEKDLAGRSAPGGITIWVGRFHDGKGGLKAAVPENDRYFVSVHLQALAYSVQAPQMGMIELYPSIGLMGQINASAGNADLDAALKQLVTDSLAPLAELDAKARGKIGDMDPPWGKEARGAQVRIRAEKKAWRANETIVLEAAKMGAGRAAATRKEARG